MTTAQDKPKTRRQLARDLGFRTIPEADRFVARALARRVDRNSVPGSTAMRAPRLQMEDCLDGWTSAYFGGSKLVRDIWAATIWGEEDNVKHLDRVIRLAIEEMRLATESNYRLTTG